MIVPNEDSSLLHLYECGKCKKIYRRSVQLVSCAVLHSPGSCCHYGEKEISFADFMIILNHVNSTVGHYTFVEQLRKGE